MHNKNFSKVMDSVFLSALQVWQLQEPFCNDY